MANHKITELTQDTVPARTDLLYKVDAAGTADRSVSFADLLKLAQAADVSGLGSFALISSLAHSATTGQTANDHHAQSHAHSGADGSGTVAHSATTGIGNDDHHAKSHAHNGADGSGTVAYSSVSGTPTIPSFATPAIVFGTAAAAGAASTVIRSDATVLAFDATAPVTQAFSDAAAVGSATVAARRDHKHGMPASPSVPAAASTVTDETSFGVAKAVGTAAAFAREDHTHGSPTNPVSYATPTIALGSSASVGSAASVVHSDATIAAFDATVPTTSAAGDTAAIGSVAFAARRDHTHGREFGDVRTISANRTLPADNSWTPVDYCEIGSGIAFEIASGAVVEILA